jgi:hypothetical protein
MLAFNKLRRNWWVESLWIEGAEATRMANSDDVIVLAKACL